LSGGACGIQEYCFSQLFKGFLGFCKRIFGVFGQSCTWIVINELLKFLPSANGQSTPKMSIKMITIKNQ
jgi:hypothetical protein